MPHDFTTDLDVRGATALIAQQMLLKRFDSMPEGQSFQLQGDHDPKKLQDLLQMRLRDDFTWTSLEAGPAVWRVQIAKHAPVSSHCCSGGACGG